MQRWLWLPAVLLLVILHALPAKAQEQPVPDSATKAPLPLNETIDGEFQQSDEATAAESPDTTATYPEDFSPAPATSGQHAAYSAFGEDETDPRVEWGGEPQVSE